MKISARCPEAANLTPELATKVFEKLSQSILKKNAATCESVAPHKGE